MGHGAKLKSLMMQETKFLSFTVNMKKKPSELIKILGKANMSKWAIVLILDFYKKWIAMEHISEVLKYLDLSERDCHHYVNPLGIGAKFVAGHLWANEGYAFGTLKTSWWIGIPTLFDLTV